MDYVDFMLWKLLALAIIAFVWGLFCGISGLPLDPRDWRGKGD